MSKKNLLLPGLGGLVVPERPRALIGNPRADLPVEVKALMDTIQKTVADMRASNDEALKGKADVVAPEQVERINAEISAKMDEFSVKLQAMALAGSSDENETVFGDIPKTPAANVQAFKQYMRIGDERMDAEVVKAAMTRGTDADGGFTAPVEWDRSLMGKLKQISRIRENAKVQTISVAGFKKLYTDRAVGSGWVGETAARPATSTPQFAMLDFSPGEIYANPAISMQLLQDSALDLESWLAGEVEYEFARQEGIAFLSGDGTNKPFGILTYVTGAANAAKHPWGAITVVNSGAAAAVTGDGLLSLVYDLPSEFTNNAKFYLNRASLGAIRKLKDGQGNYLWQPTFVSGQPQTIAGYPVVEIPGMPAIAADNIAMLFGHPGLVYRLSAVWRLQAGLSDR